MVRGEGFEPPNSERADLQSAVFDRFTIPANGQNNSIRIAHLTLDDKGYAAYRLICRFTDIGLWPP